MTRLFFAHAAISLIPIVVLSTVLIFTSSRDSRGQARADGVLDARTVAQTAVEPILTGHALNQALTADEKRRLAAIVGRPVKERDVLRLRLRDLAGRLVFSDDNSGTLGTIDPRAIEAQSSGAVGEIVQVDSTKSDGTASSVSAVKVFRPLAAGDPAQRVGVMELDLRYEPIKANAEGGLSKLQRNLAICLGALYVALFAIAFSVSRGLRKEVRSNAFRAEHDELTDLPNRGLFHRRAAAAIKTASGKKSVVIAIMDLDHFKDVNDTLGHQNGDLLLAELARRLDVNTRPEDTVARLGGDEFGVILRDVTNAEEALWRLRQIMDREIDVSGLPLSVDTSIGFVVAPADGKDVDDLMQRADVAMYLAKSNHVGVMRYDPDRDDYDASKLGLIAELRTAIDAGQLVLHYQPKASIRTGEIEAVEALVRWRHPTRGLLYPDTFLPLAEQTDLIDKLTDWVLATALDDLHYLGRFNKKLAMAVNVSARSLSRPDFASRVEAALDEARVAPTRLIVEITETALVTDPTRAAIVLGQLDDAGVRVSIDDFGKGQTSLGYLSELPVHELKIDRIFVWDMLDNPAHAAIVRSIVDLGHNLSMRVIAEGVETEEVLDRLRENGCDVVQGFLLARPMTFAALEKWLEERAPKPPRRRPLTNRHATPAG
jgi:diguanylate cyclase